MSNPLGTQQNSIIQIIIRGRPIAKGLPGMEYQRYLDTQLLLTVLEAEQRDQVIDDRFRGIFWTNKVKSYPQKKEEFSPSSCDPIGATARIFDKPAIRSGNSLLRARQSSVYHSSSSGVTILIVQ